MPELPEVETVVRGLAPLLAGRRLARVIARRPDLRWPLPPDLGQRLTGATVTGLSRRGKFGLVHTDRGEALIFHLGMSGRIRLDPNELGPHDHVLFETDGGRLAFHDPRRFGAMDMAATEALVSHRWLAAMGPEPLDADLPPDHLARAATGRRVAVKAFLMDQRIIAGVGNIYASEALFRAGIAPTRPAGRVSAERLRRLQSVLREVLEDSIAAGGSSLRDHQQVSGELGTYQHGFLVYGREGLPCPSCGARVANTAIGGRSSFHCRRCQR
ncbi:MAG: bifunctional DNA-formamidopyrimidine glycosylase/DNA-(apurinic or apyrimidinic site) lyase [Thermaurantiacus sp.]